TIYRGSYIGYYWCSTHVLDYTYTDGTQETFAVGLNSAIYHIWRHPGGSWSGWKSLGGIANDGVGLANLSSTDWPGIYIVGTEGATGATRMAPQAGLASVR